MGLFNTNVDHTEAINLLLNKISKLEEYQNYLERAYFLKLDALESRLETIYKYVDTKVSVVDGFEKRAKEAVKDIAEEVKFFHAVIKELQDEKTYKKKK